jgi:hypothetical protein
VLPSRRARERQRRRTCQADRTFGSIEVDVMVRIGHGAEVKTVAAVLRALKGSA